MLNIEQSNIYPCSVKLGSIIFLLLFNINVDFLLFFNNFYSEICTKILTTLTISLLVFVRTTHDV